MIGDSNGKSSDFEDKIFQITQPHLYDGKGNNEQLGRQPLSNTTLEINMYTLDSVELKCLAKGTSYGKGMEILKLFPPQNPVRKYSNIMLLID